jgi:hypothetical protein
MMANMQCKENHKMKITRNQLKQIIKEELSRSGAEVDSWVPDDTVFGQKRSHAPRSRTDRLDNDGDGEIDEMGEKSEQEFTAQLAALRGQNLYKTSFKKRYQFFITHFTPSDTLLNNESLIRDNIRVSVQDIEDAKSDIASDGATLLSHVRALAIAEAKYAFWSPLLDLVKAKVNLEATKDKMKEAGWSEALDDEFMRKLTKLANLSAAVQ